MAMISNLSVFVIFQIFSMLLNKDVIDIEKPDEISSLTFVEDQFSGLFLHPSIFSRSA